MAWTPFKLPQLPAGVSELGSALGAATDAVSTLLTTLKVAAEIISAADLSAVSADQLALQAAVKALQSQIDTLLTGTGVYLLLVPVRRQVIIQAGLAKAMEAAGISSLPRAPVDNAVLQTLAPVGSSAFYTSIPGATGGNAGFVRTVVESLTDLGDPNRPQFDAKTAVAGAVMVAGATNYLQIISLSATISAIFAKSKPANGLDMPEIPAPQDLKVTQTGGGVFLDWKATPPVSILPTLGVSATVTEVAIIRSTTPDLMSATSAVGLFGTATLTKGLSTGKASVISVYSYSAATPITNYLDAVDPFGGPYYYAVAYRTTVGGEDLGYGRLSGVRKAKIQLTPSRTAKATAPDWQRTAAPVGLIPDLGEVLGFVKLQLTQLASTGSDYKSLVSGYTNYLDQEITRFVTVSQQITDKVKALSSLLSAGNTGGAYFRTFAGTGGNQFLVNDLAKSMTGSDPSRPPFDKGSEYVMGFVIVAGAPTLGALAPLQTFLTTLFGGGAAVESAVAKAVATVGAGVDKAISQITADLLAGNAYGTSTQTSQGLPLVGADDDGTNQNC